MEIHIGNGLDVFVFGMTTDEVKNILGEPNKISHEERERGIVYIYNKMMTKFIFDEEVDFKLNSIEIHNPDVNMFSNKVINMAYEEIESLLRRNGYNEFEHEAYVFFETLYVEELNTTFQFIFNKVRSLEFSPLYNGEGDYIWPNKYYD